MPTIDDRRDASAREDGAVFADDRAVEEADFETARVGGGRRRPSIAVLGWVVVLICVIAFGLSGRSDGSGSAAAGVGAGASGEVGVRGSAAVAPATTRATDRVVPPRFEPDGVPIDNGISGPIHLAATRHPSTVYVHGDVFAQQVTWVFVGLQTLDGQVAGWASVTIPGAAGDGRDHRPALRFDVELAIPGTLATGVLIVHANAYNAVGGLVAATRVRLEPQT
jgi:hypothetical protein